MLDITEFKGEIPRLHPRRLPPGFAQYCSNARLERGVLSPYREPVLAATVGATAETITLFSGQWIGFTGDVDAVPGPVAGERLYYTGIGAPKVRLPSGVQYNLRWDAPSAVPTAALIANGEYLIVDGRPIRLMNGVSFGGAGVSGITGIRVAVSTRYNVATVVISHDSGFSIANAEAIVNSLRYSNHNQAARLCKGLKLVRITEMTDSGGQTLDAENLPIGSPTRTIDDVISTVRVGGTKLTYSVPDPLTQDNTDVADQNDPPTLAATALHPLFGFGDHPTGVALFSGATISTIEAGQTIKSLTVVVETLANAILDPATYETIAYCYTLVSTLDEESQPSPITSLDWSPGQGIVVANLLTPSGTASRIKSKRVYRSQTSSSGVTDLYFVAEIPAASTSMLDFPDEMPLQEPLPSLHYDPPRDDLTGIVALPNGILAAFAGRTLCFSEPWRPHAWPAKYQLTTDYTIVGLAAAGSVLIVLTSGMPYAVSGTHPDNMQMAKIEENAPCVSKRSIVDLGFAVAFASTDGIVGIDASGRVRFATRDLFTGDQWDNMVPSQMIAAQYQQRYVVSHPSGTTRRTLVVDLSGETPYVIRTAWDAYAFHYHLPTGRLFYMRDPGGIYLADPIGGDYSPLRWRSAPIVLPVTVNMGAILIEGDSINAKTRLLAKVYGDGRLRATVTTPNEIVRLPSGYTARSWFVEIWGNFQITGIHMARTVTELKQRAPG